MSYEIIYNGFAVKNNDDTFDIYLEQGSNNVWEANGRRRARNWYCPLELRGKTKAEITSWVESVVNSSLKWKLNEGMTEAEAFEAVNKDMGYYSSIKFHGRSNYSIKSFRNYFNRLIAESKTRAEHEADRVHFYTYKNTYSDGVTYTCAGYYKPKKSRTKKSPQPVKYFFVIKFKDGYFLYKKRKYGYSKVPFENSGKRFKEFSDAMRYAKKYALDFLDIIKVDREAYL